MIQQPVASTGRGHKGRRLALFSAVAALVAAAAFVLGARLIQRDSGAITFVVTSDAHYGITRPSFRGQHDVDAHVVNTALVRAINGLPGVRFPDDRGIGATRAVGAVEFVAETGDITNREEDHDDVSIQSASRSWTQFVDDYLHGVRLTTGSGAATPVFVVPGNHEASNAVGFYKTMSPPTDITPLVEIYNLMVAPAVKKTPATFEYDRDRVFFTRDVGGVHLVFLHIWPDSAMRARMDRDLASVPATTPVILFTHDQPDVEAKHFVNPNGAHDVNDADQFENLLADAFADGDTVDTLSLAEQTQFEVWLRAHRNVTAYFHGNSNWHQAYEWSGPARSARLHTFRVDSPMKGAVSAGDETRLSFEVATLDTATRTLTVRECLWNADPAHPDAPVRWGDSVTVTLDPRPGAVTTSSRPASTF